MLPLRSRPRKPAPKIAKKGGSAAPTRTRTARSRPKSFSARAARRSPSSTATPTERVVRGVGGQDDHKFHGADKDRNGVLTAAEYATTAPPPPKHAKSRGANVAMRIFTIGYGRDRGRVPRRLAAGRHRGDRRRALPLSRRPAFPRRRSAGTGEAGIDYVHLKALGTPTREGRRRAGGMRTDAGSSSLPRRSRNRRSDRARTRAPCLLRARGRVPSDMLLDAVAPDAEVTHLFA